MSRQQRLRGFEKVSQYQNEYVPMPKRASAHSAGYDFFLLNDVTIEPGERRVFATGLKAYMKPDEYLAIHIRSSLAFKYGLRLINATAVIDADYYNNPDNEGHILVCLKNEGSVPVTIRRGDRIVQGIFSKFLLADGDEERNARNGGIGSSGVGV